jgi:hypothetical protein
MPLEILHLALVLFGRRARLEGAEIAALAGLGIGFAGIEPVLAGLQFADHGGISSYATLNGGRLPGVPWHDPAHDRPASLSREMPLISCYCLPCGATRA